MSYSIAQSVIVVLQCSPAKALWDPRVKGQCIDISIELVGSSVLNVATNFLILALPLPILWRLQISMRKKLQLVGIFLLGGV